MPRTWRGGRRVKKSQLAKENERLRGEVRRMQDRRTAEERERQEAFDAALADLRGPRQVLMITPSGYLLRGTVSKLEIDVEAVDVSPGPGWREFMPGRRSVEIRIVPVP